MFFSDFWTKLFWSWSQKSQDVEGGAGAWNFSTGSTALILILLRNEWPKCLSGKKTGLQRVFGFANAFWQYEIALFLISLHQTASDAETLHVNNCSVCLLLHFMSVTIQSCTQSNGQLTFADNVLCAVLSGDCSALWSRTDLHLCRVQRTRPQYKLMQWHNRVCDTTEWHNRVTQPSSNTLWRRQVKRN